LERIKLDHIDLGLNLAYSYILPLFNVNVLDDGIHILKAYGVCRGLECFVNNVGTLCYIPNTCIEEHYKCILGLDKAFLVDELIRYFDLTNLDAIFHRFTPIYSPGDSLFIAITIYLSRNTDYYVNTIKWVRAFIEKECFFNKMNCENLFNSYQFRELMSNLDVIRVVMDSERDFVKQSVELMSIRGFGVKSAMAYILHAGGLTKYAPIDRHYLSVLEKTGIDASQPVKKQCIENMLLCSSCRYRRKCLYGFIQEKLGVFNGLIQSIIYVYGRVSKSKYRLSMLEQILLSKLPLNEFVKGVDKFIDILREVLS